VLLQGRSSARRAGAAPRGGIGLVGEGVPLQGHSGACRAGAALLAEASAWLATG
jgi:hypothetical protein